MGESTHSPGLVVAGDRWAMAQLSASGEDVVGRIRLPQFLLLARTLLLPPLGGHARRRCQDWLLMPCNCHLA